MRYVVEPLPIRHVGNFEEYKAKGDGNCLFHSLCFLVHTFRLPVTIDPQELRETAVHYMETAIVNDQFDRPWNVEGDYQTYLTGMMQPATWGDGNCIRAIAEENGITIVVHHDFGFPEVFGNGELALNLIYRGRNHYNPLLPAVGMLPPIREEEDDPPKPLVEEPAKDVILVIPRPHAVRLDQPNLLVIERCPCAVERMSSVAMQVPIYRMGIDPEEAWISEWRPRAFCIYPELTELPFFFVEPAEEYILEGGFEASTYDWYTGSCAKRGRLIGGVGPYFNRLFRFQELAFYAQRALFNEGVAGCKGTMHVRSEPQGTEVTLKKSGTTIQVHDGWGYVKRCLAKQLEATRTGEKVALRRPEASFQMFQWLEEGQDADPTEEEVIAELLKAGEAREADDVDDADDADDAVYIHGIDMAKRKALIELRPALAEHPFLVELGKGAWARQARIRATTGNPPLLQGIAVPVTGKNLVVPNLGAKLGDAPPLVQALANVGAKTKKVAVYRPPGDRLNWVAPPDVDRDSDLATLFGTMEAIQYSLTGKRNETLAFYKGMLGIIEDDEWPDEWKDVCVVVANDDLKADETWNEEKDVRASKDSEEASEFELTGCLAVTQWFAAGSLIGIPYELQSALAGDYDGDLITLLSADELPKTYEYIVQRIPDALPNPKLTKRFTPCEDENASRSDCIVRIFEARTLVGRWSNVAAMVLSAPDETIENIAAQLDYTDRQALLTRVSLGIKEGTDAFKTTVDIGASETAVGDLFDALRTAGCYAPQTKMKNDPLLFRSATHVPQILRDGEQPQNMPWHKKFAVRPNMRGIPAGLMRRVIPTLHPPAPKVQPLRAYRDLAPRPRGAAAWNVVNMLKYACTQTLETLDPLDRTEGPRYLVAWRQLVAEITVPRQMDAPTFVALAWYALHDAENLTPTSWRRVYGLFLDFYDALVELLRPM